MINVQKIPDSGNPYNMAIHFSSSNGLCKKALDVVLSECVSVLEANGVIVDHVSFDSSSVDNSRFKLVDVECEYWYEEILFELTNDGVISLSFEKDKSADRYLDLIFMLFIKKHLNDMVEVMVKNV